MGGIESKKLLQFIPSRKKFRFSEKMMKLFLKKLEKSFSFLKMKISYIKGLGGFLLGNIPLG
ncbi:hypothetical protein DEX24_16395 [Kurthia sibirica]|uniref:Uncharacterized protein n=1 Tax=Kurthia sibirica TaxID=202750 RepID=A0A2U3AEZ0_9BACL|nr:hypothetical protein DEX24_16395 [Kurthia sibirica]